MGLRRKQLDDPVEGVGQVEGLRFEFELASLDSRDVEDLVDDSGQVDAGVFDGLGVFGLLVVEPGVQQRCPCRPPRSRVLTRAHIARIRFSARGLLGASFALRISYSARFALWRPGHSENGCRREGWRSSQGSVVEAETEVERRRGGASLLDGAQ
jgi:hypothetical protein